MKTKEIQEQQIFVELKQVLEAQKEDFEVERLQSLLDSLTGRCVEVKQFLNASN